MNLKNQKQKQLEHMDSKRLNEMIKALVNNMEKSLKHVSNEKGIDNSVISRGKEAINILKSGKSPELIKNNLEKLQVEHNKYMKKNGL